MVLGFRLYVRCKLVAVWWMANKRTSCFITAFHNFATLENRLTYQCPSSWPVVITMKKKLASTWKKNIGCWPVQISGNRFATGQILEKPVEVVKGRILAGWAQKSPEPWYELSLCSKVKNIYNSSPPNLAPTNVSSLRMSLGIAYAKVNHLSLIMTTITNMYGFDVRRMKIVQHYRKWEVNLKVCGNESRDD
jgi:hypothetical protein